MSKHVVRAEASPDDLPEVIDISDLEAELSNRAANIAQKQAKSTFDHCEFEGYFVSGRIKGGGEFEVVIGIDPDQKAQALPVSDAAGLMLHISISRKSYKSEGNHNGDHKR